MIQDLFVWRFTRCQIEYTFASGYSTAPGQGNKEQQSPSMQVTAYYVWVRSSIQWLLSPLEINTYDQCFHHLLSCLKMPLVKWWEAHCMGGIFFLFWSEQWFSKHGISWPRLTPVQKSRKHLVMWRRPSLCKRRMPLCLGIKHPISVVYVYQQYARLIVTDLLLVICL